MKKAVIHIIFVFVFCVPTIVPTPAFAVTEAMWKSCNRSENWLLWMVCGYASPLTVGLDLLTQPVFTTDGKTMYGGFEKEFDIRLSRSTDSTGVYQIHHNLFMTPSIVFSQSMKNFLFRFRAGYHFEFARRLSSEYDSNRKLTNKGLIGVSTGVGISAGYKTGAGPFFGGGPDIKFFYQLLNHTRLVVGTRFEYQTIKAWQVDVSAGLSFLF